MRRDRQKRWDWAHMTTVSCHLREDEAAELHRLAAQRNTTLYAVLQKVLRRWAKGELEP